ncbi:Hypothetical predicted protein [Mytilus galloprovincialis]|uniref:Reverse transcriptase domain-containing protein n=1 Tax=Mytilus galloprovincialis TaxID=29158 RepID=A0A8B6H0E1_MYTGA|nr:Hypothetical predicted protein [Mytilus galloprovincialis]
MGKDDVCKAGEEALVKVYGGMPLEGLDILRLRKFTTKTMALNRSSIVQVQTLPPTSDAAKFHSMRLIRKSKNKHRELDLAGRPRNNHKLFLAKKEAKRILRQQQRKEIAIERQQFFDKLEHDPNDKTFFQLLKRNQSTVKSSVPEYIMKKEQIASTSNEQRQIFAEYFKELATPQNQPEFNDQLMQNSQRRYDIIKKVSKSERKRKIDVSKDEIKKAILKLKNGKTADEYGIRAEHIKHTGDEALIAYQTIFKQILEEGKVAKSFKTGVITPVLKKGKNAMYTENYRGITVTSIHGKVFEYVLIEKAKIRKMNQSNMQFGFTEGLSPNMASLILSEVCSEITGKNKLLFITTLDSQKAFDVVNHQILLDKMYFLGMDIQFWDIIEDLYEDITSTVKWQGDQSFI